LPHGTFFTQVDPAGGLEILPHAAGVGGTDLTVMSYDRLVPVARREFSLLNQFTSPRNANGAVGVEAVSRMSRA
jgi:hypothetical protein